MSRRALRPALAAALLLPALGGCISLLPKQTPAQLYRFDARASAPAPAADDAPRVGVVAPPVAVEPAAAGDRLLTVTGSQAAFIAGARWVSPAAVLWDEAVRRAFLARAGHVRLLSRNELAGGAAFLRLDVPEFEVRYPAAGAVPTVHVTLHAALDHRTGVFSSEHTFTADAPAAADRMSAIVDAYDAAVEQVVTALLAWSDAHADAAAAAAALSESAPRPAVRSTTVTSTTTSRTTQRPPR